MAGDCEYDGFGMFRRIASTDGGAHRIERVLLFDSLQSLLSLRVNSDGTGREVRPMAELSKAFGGRGDRGAEHRRYHYRGEARGHMEGYFCAYDPTFYAWTEGGLRRIASVPSYDMAHFLCDLFGEESVSAAMVEWVSAVPELRREASEAALRRMEKA